MPREVKAYLCSFSCGRQATIKKEAVEKHEKTCFKNPERKACATCGWHSKHLVDIPDKPGYVKNQNECNKEGFKPPEMYQKHNVAWDCPGWISEDDWADLEDARIEAEEKYSDSIF